MASKSSAKNKLKNVSISYTSHTCDTAVGTIFVYKSQLTSHDLVGCDVSVMAVLSKTFEATASDCYVSLDDEVSKVSNKLFYCAVTSVMFSFKLLGNFIFASSIPSSRHGCTGSQQLQHIKNGCSGI